MKSVLQQVCRYSPNAILIIVSNPLDAMCHVAMEESGFLKQNHRHGRRARFRTVSRFISMELDVSVENIQALVLVGHGDTMVPLPRFSTVAGVPVTELMSPERIDVRWPCAHAMVVRKSSDFLKTGSAYYAPASAAVEMAESILKDKRKSCPAPLSWKVNTAFPVCLSGVPVKLGKNGIEQIISLKLTAEEQKALDRSAASVKELVDAMKKMT